MKKEWSLGLVYQKLEGQMPILPTPIQFLHPWLCPLIRIYDAFFRPGNAEAYLCTPMKLDKSNTNYIVGFEPTAHKDTAHHMILYGCKSPARQEAIYNCGGME